MGTSAPVKAPKSAPVKAAASGEGAYPAAEKSAGQAVRAKIGTAAAADQSPAGQPRGGARDPGPATDPVEELGRFARRGVP